MSFSSETKKDILSSQDSKKKCCEISFLYGILLTANTFGKDKIVLKSENSEFMNIVRELIVKYAKIDCRVESGGKSMLCTIEFAGTESEKITGLFKNGTFRCSKCRSNFISGSFLSCGTLSSPDKNYYIEMKIGSEEVKDEILSVLHTESFDFKSIQRRGKFYLYLKESERIEDFLYYIGAKQASYKIMEAKIVKELRNNINRTINFENANMEKISSAAAYQIKMIDKLIDEGKFGGLDDDLKETAMLRKENVGLSLEEIAALSSKKTSKTGIFRRLKKIIEIAEKDASL